ncbi:Hypothetical protein SRAE_2000321400 [Strongyloides ratti]|uniref:Uncharacterized protein n=1 Tax=Strongyloides ratti TaxID=34506 RepID=A0A090LK81_STRRB|nr:Hypothetical protein SRAE_2000321400 [Strongyloides ratti]CEF68558.1 Hypothetical protein SRAE_2000321400 [Strongyloides ratti]
MNNFGSKKGDHNWGDYYFGGRKSNAKRSWALEVLHSLNQMIPTFNELFDKETFYMFAIFVVLLTILVVVILAKFFKIKIKEHPIHINREWRDGRPANPFKFPWQNAKIDKKRKIE